MNFRQKSDYENFPPQISYQNVPVVAQPMANPMMPITHPTSNMENQIVQTNVNQMPSQSATVNSNAGQVIAPTTSSVESEVKPLPPIRSPQSDLSHTDCGDANAINGLSKPEDQQNVEN